MSSTHQQKALFLTSKFGEFAVSNTAILKPGPGDLLVRNEAVALNPVDWKIQKYGFAVETFPAIIGMDLAGIVEEVGEGVTELKKGDKIVAHGNWVNDRGAFQQYTIAAARFSAKIPSPLSFEEASTIPMGIMTAVVGLYDKHAFGAGLVAPWEQAGRGHYSGKPILVMGGSSSVGSYVIQLARLSGFSPIITTASPKHTEYLQSLGATQVLDRNQPLSALGSFGIIFDAVGVADTQNAAVQLLAPGGTFICVTPSVLGDLDSGKTFKTMYANAYVPENEAVGTGVFGNLEQYLADGSIKPNRVKLISGGLKGIVTGLDMLSEDKVSGVKLVVRPQDTL